MQQNRFSGLKESKKEPFFGVQMGPINGVILPPFRWGSEKGSKVEVFDGLRIYSGADEWFSWFGVKACATESFQWTQRVQKRSPFLESNWDP